MLKKIIYRSIYILVAFFLIKTSFVSAAVLYLEPPSGDLIKGCNSGIQVKISTEGASVNGSQVYIDYSSGISSISISGGNAFSTYGTPPGIPSQRLGIYGYGGVINGNDINFANININSNLNGPIVLTLRFETTEMASKIAEDPSSNNILTSVTSGNYNIIDGYCETSPPYMVDLNPAVDKPNHSVGQNIIFDLKDDGSGIDISTLQISVKQNNTDRSFDIVKTQHGTDFKWYSIVIDPTDDLIPELKVVVSLTVQDKAGNTMNKTYSFNDLTCAQLGCFVGGIASQCSDGIDNDNDGLIDFPSDSGCIDADDNNEWQSGDCPTSTSTEPMITQCSDGIDNDNDGLIDAADLGCESASDNNEFVFGDTPCPVCDICTTTIVVISTTTPVTTTPIIQDKKTLTIENLKFYLANRTIRAYPDKFSFIDTLSGSTFSVAIDTSILDSSVSKATLLIGDKHYSMFYDNGLRMYVVDVGDLTSQKSLNSSVVIKHGADEHLVIPFIIKVAAKGLIQISEKSIVKNLADADVKLEQLSNGKYIQIIKTKSDKYGLYGFVVPNGAYRLTVEASGVTKEQTSGFVINNNIINRSFKLLVPVNLLDAEIPITEKASYVINITQDKASKIIESINDPVVEETVKSKVAPIAMVSTIAATVPALSLLNLLSYLRFLFLQPIFLLGSRKRKKWGVVYNSLTKLPVDLALVRVIDVKTSRVIQSRVTDRGGRYSFFVKPGLYRLEVVKKGFMFPTKILQDFKEDTGFLDLYHGEPVHVDDKYVAISANIPLDPSGASEKTPRRLVLDRWWRGIQRFIASLSIAAGIIAVVISPGVLTIGLLALQVLLYFLFKRVATTKKPKNWGIVYDKDNKKPINRVIARLFSKKFNKLIATEVTDKNGRYSFRVGPNQYYVTFEKTGYDKTVSRSIKIVKENEVVKVDVGLDKNSKNKKQEVAETKTRKRESISKSKKVLDTAVEKAKTSGKIDNADIEKVSETIKQYRDKM